MIREWWASIKANSPEARRRELRAICDEMRYLVREYDRLAERRDELVNDLKPEAPELRVVGR